MNKYVNHITDMICDHQPFLYYPSSIQPARCTQVCILALPSEVTTFFAISYCLCTSVLRGVAQVRIYQHKNPAGN